MSREEILRKVKDIILKTLEVDIIILFGSYAREMERYDSDIDIAIKPTNNIEKEYLIRLQTTLEEEINIDVHLINLCTIEEDFRYDILITGKPLYIKNNDKFWEYNFRAYSDYLELNENRKIILDKLREGGTLYGKWVSYT